MCILDCSVSMYQCGDSCIDKDKLCDGLEDCTDGRDEQEICGGSFSAIFG